MTTTDSLRPSIKDDIPDLKSILDSIDLFPSEMLEEMMAPYLEDPQSGELWYTVFQNGRAVGLAYCAPEKLTQGTYNLYAIGVHAELQSKGLGRKLLLHIETELREQGQRVLIVDTSGTEAFRKTRNFYEQLHYVKEAVIRDFWEEGDDKVVYWKKL